MAELDSLIRKIVLENYEFREKKLFIAALGFYAFSGLPIRFSKRLPVLPYHRCSLSFQVSYG